MYPTTSQKKARLVRIKIVPRINKRIAPAMLTTMDWITTTTTAAVPSKIPREMPVTQAKTMSGPTENKTSDDKNICLDFSNHCLGQNLEDKLQNTTVLV
jgi:hypothetical protein